MPSSLERHRKDVEWTTVADVYIGGQHWLDRKRISAMRLKDAGPAAIARILDFSPTQIYCVFREA